MASNVDGMFTTGGLAVFLIRGSEVGNGRRHPTRIPVYLGDACRPVDVTVDDLRCPECGDHHDVPERNPAKWLAANKVMNAGKCVDCIDG